MKKVMVLTGALLLAACGQQNVNLDLSTGKVAGAGAGYTFGDSLLPSDHAVFQEQTRRAMADAGNGQVVNWINPSTGVAGTITPTRSYYVGQGQVCREFQATISAPEGIGRGTGMACKVAGGAWQIKPPV